MTRITPERTSFPVLAIERLRDSFVQQSVLGWSSNAYRSPNMMKPLFEPFPQLDVAPRYFTVYIDGYNLYMAINHPKPDHLLGLGWCNYQRLGALLVEKSFACPAEKRRVEVKYFTSKVDDRTAHKGEIRRQQMWLEALKLEAPMLNEKTIRWGIWSPAGQRKEKKTDVNLALEITRDIINIRPSGIVLVSGDLDFQPIVEDVLDKGVPIAVFIPDYYCPRQRRIVGFGRHKPRVLSGDGRRSRRRSP